MINVTFFPLIFLFLRKEKLNQEPKKIVFFTISILWNRTSYFLLSRYSMIIIILHLYCHYNRALLTIGFGLFTFARYCYTNPTRLTIIYYTFFQRRTIKWNKFECCNAPMCNDSTNKCDIIVNAATKSHHEQSSSYTTNIFEERRNTSCFNIFLSYARLTCLNSPICLT